MVQNVCKWSDVNPQWWLYSLAHHTKDGCECCTGGGTDLRKWVTIWGCQFDNNEGVEMAICEWLWMQEPDFCDDRILHSSQDEKLC